MLWQDLRYAFRHLTRTPLFTLSSVGLLAIGVGANIAVFAVVDRLLVRPLPYDRPGEVVFIYQDSDEGEPSTAAFPAYRDIASTSGVFSAVTAMSPSTVTWTRDDRKLDAAIEYTTASYIDVAGRAMHLGRWLDRRTDAVGGPLEAVITEPAWRAKFGSDPSVLGRTVRLNDQTVTVVGVGPAGLPGSYPPLATDFWVSISSTIIDGPYRATNLDVREDHWYDVRARRAEGVTVAAAQDAMTALANAMGEAHPDVDRGRGLTVRSASDVQLYPDTEAALLAASAIAALLLVLGVANLANLLLVRAIGRSGEMAVRRALGASATRIARLHVVESLILAIVGGIAGLVVARLALDALRLASLPPAIAAAMGLPIDGRVAGFAIGIVLGCGVLLGLAPAWRSMWGDVTSAIRDDRRTSSASRMTVRLRGGLVAIQVAVSLVLLVSAGLLARSLAVMLQVDPGVDADRIAYLRMNLGDDGAPAATLDQVLARVASLPGVTHAAGASRLPAQNSGTTSTIVEGYSPPVGTDAVELGFTAVTPDYFDAVGLSLIQGRGFAATDGAGGSRAVVVNESAARLFWGEASAIGRRLRSQSRPDLVRTVVGVVEDAPVSSFPEQSTPSMFYLPAGQANLTRPYVLARTSGDAAPHVRTIAGAVTAMRSTFEIQTEGTLSSHLGSSLIIPRTMVRAMSTVSLLALALAALGIYAVVAFNVARRTTELGIRIALGATAAQVVRMVVLEASGAVVFGLICGLGLAVLTVPQMASLLFGVPAIDPAAFAGSIAVLAVASWAAAYVPARRAAGTDPAVALRTM
jgi:predicted permease